MTRRARDAFEPFDPTGAFDEGATLLEASAGTGKTYQITSLALRLVAELGLRLPDILVVTFTRAATSELRDRVRRRLGAGITALEHALAESGWEPDEADDDVVAHLVRTGRDRGDDELRRRLRRLVTAREEFDDATISTIHGFCQDTLRHSAFESDVDLEAELVEDIGELLEEIVHDFMVRELRSADDDWYAHLRTHGVDLADLRALARKLEAEPHLRVVPEDPIDDPEEVWAATVERFRDTWRDHREGAIAWLRTQARDGALQRRKEYREQLEDKVRAVDEWCDGIAARYPTVWDDSTWFTTDELRTRTGDDFLDSPVFAEFDRLRELGGAPATAFKRRFADEVGAELTARKAARNILSFDDLLLALRDGLARPETRRALHAVLTTRYRAALIDEFQDTDPVQWQIFETVFGEHGHLYLIGDPKQAIYAFRGADVHTYLAAAERIAEPRTLDTNWRSDAPYVHALNRLFAGHDGPDGTEDGRGPLGHPEIPYRPVEVAPPNREARISFPDGPRPALELVHVRRELAGVDGTKNISAKWAGRELPGLVAADIVGFLGSGAKIRPKGEEDACGVLPRDVAVLTRTNAQARSVQEALRENGVHAVTGGGGSVFESPEAVLLQRLLAGLLRPHVDRDAKAALTTPLLGVDGHELTTMDESSWESSVGSLARWSATWRDHGIAEAARHVFDEAGVRARVLALPSGERRLTNVLHLLELVHAAEQSERLGPSGLHAWLRDRRADPPVDQEATEVRLESDEDAVTVVTVHRAKGLEYPAVWCPWLWQEPKLFPGEDRNLRFHHPQYGGDLALDVAVDPKVPPKDDHVEIARREVWEERLRILYVALTRARHRCTVHWGALHGFGRSPLGRVLHDWDHETTANPKVTDEELRARLDEIAAASDGHIGVRAAAEVDEPPAYEPPPAPSGELTGRSVTRELDRRWQRTSFSRLSRQDDDAAHGERHGVDEDEVRDVDTGTSPDLREQAARDDRGADEPSAEEVPLADFPRGPAAGTFLHDVLERFDFARVDEAGVLEEVLAEQQRRHALDVDDDVPVAEGLRAVLRTPLGPAVGGARLADIGADDRLAELDFQLPLLGGYRPTDPDRALRLDHIADVLEGYGDEVPILGDYVPALRRLGSRSTRGFLTGSIDLVFRTTVDGHRRYFIADHKSNWLGRRGATGAAGRSTVAHYHPAALAEPMVGHHYVLQALIYLVGLHRLLRWRLGDAYDPDADVGGALYLFLRGMTGPATPVTGDDQPHGVLGLHPPGALIHELDELFAHGEVTT